MTILRKLWDFWKAFGHMLGQVQTAILLSVIYHLTVGPLALGAKLARRDLLELRDTGAESFATPMPHVTTTMERAEKQF